MSEIICELCNFRCEWTEAPYYESRLWELESKHYRNYRTIRLPKQYHLAGLYDYKICENCETRKDWRKAVMEKIDKEAIEICEKRKETYRWRMNKSKEEMNEWHQKLSGILRFSTDLTSRRA